MPDIAPGEVGDFQAGGRALVTSSDSSDIKPRWHDNLTHNWEEHETAMKNFYLWQIPEIPEMSRNSNGFEVVLD